MEYGLRPEFPGQKSSVSKLGQSRAKQGDWCNTDSEFSDPRELDSLLESFTRQFLSLTYINQMHTSLCKTHTVTFFKLPKGF